MPKNRPVKSALEIIREIDFKKVSIIFFVGLAIFGAYGSWHFYSKYQEIKENPNLEVQEETELLVLALSKLMELPQGETPTIAVISDKAKLADRPFFKLAENGDRLFAYNKALIAILYRPKTNKIINVAPILNDQTQNSALGAPSDMPTDTPEPVEEVVDPESAP